MGLDEVGRGCLCGPVVAAGVILRRDASVNERLRDSKSIKKMDREELALQIKDEAEYYAVRKCSPVEIDQHNILRASLLAMRRCIESEGANPDYLLIDGNKAPSTLISHACIVKGDDRSASIAAASIIAKVYRDSLMYSLHEKYPVFGWDRNVGYPTREHYNGLKEFGYTIHHRKSFKLKTEKVFSLNSASAS